MDNKKTAKKVKCNFCGKEYTMKEWNEKGIKVLRSRAGNSEGEKVRICSKCLQKAASELEKVEQNASNVSIKAKTASLLTPVEIKEHLDKWVIDQEGPKTALATELYAHNKRIARLESDAKASEELRIDKSNIIYLGPTGSGKTESVRAICSFMDLPYTIEDASSLSATGYVGRDVEDMLKNLYINAGRDLKKAQKGIIFLDEFDKIRASNDGRGDNKDVNGKAVQQSILKMIEGAVIDVKLDKLMGKSIKFDTTNVLFILGGAFVGLEKIIDKRLKSGKSNFGVNGTPVVKDRIDYNEVISQVQPQDLEKFGIIPEVIGRCPILTVFNELSTESMVKILTEPKHAIVKQYKEEFKMDGIEFEVEDGALIKIAEKAQARKMGARALKTVMENILMDAKFKAPSDKTIKKIVIREDLSVDMLRAEDLEVTAPAE